MEKTLDKVEQILEALKNSNHLGDVLKETYVLPGEFEGLLHDFQNINTPEIIYDFANQETKLYFTERTLVEEMDQEENLQRINIYLFKNDSSLRIRDLDDVDINDLGDVVEDL